MVKVADEVEARVDCLWSNIGREWTAEIRDEDSGHILAYAIGRTRAEALRSLADEIEGT